MACWSSRNCPAVLTVGEMKLMLGYVGDSRIVSLLEMAGVDENGASPPVPWGLSGGRCNVAPPSVTGMFVSTRDGSSASSATAYSMHADDAPDPTCKRGILSKVDNVTCCAASCGKCKWDEVCVERCWPPSRFHHPTLVAHPAPTQAVG
jgi:hypothetical protein